MYQYTFSNKDTETITEKTKNYSNLLDEFKQIDKKFSSLDDSELNLEKKSFEKLSDEQIKQQAENNLFDYKQSSIQNINDEYATKTDDIDQNIKQTEQSATSQKNEAKQLYSSLKQDAAKDAVKRGLARSSIVINILDAFDQGMIEEYNKINQEISTKIDSLNSKKQLLDEQKQNALNAFDISYAVKLSNKIDEINKELNEQEQKVIEYNNQIAQKEAEYEAKRKQNALDYAEYIQKNGTDTIVQLKREEKYNLAKEY
ncbi:MAG: hypothetical protein J6Q51_02640, partial [Clostridia bacterium]|nr:hypothetical protein [Clostridia bacterium]